MIGAILEWLEENNLRMCVAVVVGTTATLGLMVGLLHGAFSIYEHYRPCLRYRQYWRPAYVTMVGKTPIFHAAGWREECVLRGTREDIK